MTRSASVLGIALLSCSFAQERRELTARELFYGISEKDSRRKSVETPVKPPAPPRTELPKTVAKAKKAVPKKTQPAKTTEVAGKSGAVQPTGGTPVTTETTRPQEPAVTVAGGQQTPGAKLVNVAYSPSPLGLRYSLLKRAGDRYDEVDADTVFRAGDSIRLSVEANDRAYLYLVVRGSSGTWKVLFPSPEIDGGSNIVERERQHELPSGGRFTFDEQPGIERLFLVLSRQPEPDFEKLIYSLVPGSTPSEPATKGKTLLLAQNFGNIDDVLVNRIRTSFVARDLVFEKVDEKSAGERKEKAVYIVNPNRDPNARLIADISLKHE